MLRTYSYQGTTGKNQGGISYLYMSFDMSPDPGVITLQKIKINPPQSGTTSYTVYLNIFEKDSMQYLGSSTNAIRTTDTQNHWLFNNDILLQSDVTYLLTFSQQPSQELGGLSVTRMELWPTSIGWKCSGSGSYPGSEIAYFPGIAITGEDYEEPKIEGSIKVGKGYYKADGTNIIIFEKAMEKTLSDISGTKGYKNNIVLTLDNSGVSDFVLQGVTEGIPQGYVITKNLATNVYLNNNKDSILGTEPKEGLEVSYTNDAISVEKGYAYIGETEGSLQIPSQRVYPAWTPQEFVVHGEDFEAYIPVFVQPKFDSATSYGVVTDSRNNAGQEGWRVFQNTSSIYEPLIEGGWWKWELPEPMTLIQGESSITITGYSYYATRVIRFFADVNKTIPITAQTAVNSSASQIVNIPVTNTVTTSVIYLDVGPSSSWSPFTTFTFNNCYKDICKTGYLSLANPEGMTKLIATGMRNPTASYAGSSVTPVDLEKKVYLSEDLTKVISVEEA